MENNTYKSTSALTHLSVFSQYFIPFGNFIFPIIIWSALGKKSEFVNHNAKQVINFQLSMFLYSIIMLLIAIPVLLFSIFKNVNFSQLLTNDNYVFDHIDIAQITGIATIGISFIILFIVLKVMEIFLVIYGAVKSSNGEKWNYPLSIKFIK